MLCWDTRTQVALGCRSGGYPSIPYKLTTLSPLILSQTFPSPPIHRGEGVGSKSSPIRLGAPDKEELRPRQITLSSHRTEAKIPHLQIGASASGDLYPFLGWGSVSTIRLGGVSGKSLFPPHTLEASPGQGLRIPM